MIFGSKKHCLFFPTQSSILVNYIGAFSMLKHPWVSKSYLLKEFGLCYIINLSLSSVSLIKTFDSCLYFQLSALFV